MECQYNISIAWSPKEKSKFLLQNNTPSLKYCAQDEKKFFECTCPMDKWRRECTCPIEDRTCPDDIALHRTQSSEKKS